MTSRRSSGSRFEIGVELTLIIFFHLGGLNFAQMPPTIRSRVLRQTPGALFAFRHGRVRDAERPSTCGPLGPQRFVSESR